MRVQHPPARLRPPLPRPVWPGPAPRRRWTSACGGARGERRDGLRTRLPGAEPVLRTGRQHVTLALTDRATHRSQRSLTIRCVVCMITLFSSICFVRAEFPRAVAGHKPGAQRVTTQYRLSRSDSPPPFHVPMRDRGGSDVHVSRPADDSAMHLSLLRWLGHGRQLQLDRRLDRVVLRRAHRDVVPLQRHATPGH